MHALASLRSLWQRTFALAALVLTPQAAAAQQYTWNLTGGGEWLNANNWTPAGGPPNAIGATASFGNSITSSSAVTITGAATVGEINFTGITGTKAYTIGAAGNTITLSGGGTVTLSADTSVTSTGTQLIQSNLAASGGSAFAAAIQGGTVQVDGGVSGTGGLTKTGAGTLILTANNTGLTGGIVINGGTLEARGESTFPPPDTNGLGANAVTVNAGGQLKLVGTAFWTPTNPLTIAGNGPAGAPQYSDVALWDRSSQYQGPIGLSADASIRCEGFMFRGVAGTVGLALNGNRVRFTGDVATVGGVDGVISDGSAAGGRVLIDIDGGNISFNNSANTYTGTTVINRGTLFITSGGALGQGLGTAANGVVVNNSGGAFGVAQLYLNGTGTYTVSNKLLTLNGGAVVANGGNKTWTGAVNLTADSIIGAEGINGRFTLTGGIDLGNHVLTLRPNFNDSVININTNGITGTGSVIVIPVTGQGTINLNVSSSYSGGTTIQSHNVFVNATQGTGTGAVTVSGGSLRGTGSVTGAVTVTSGSIFPGSASATGNLTLNGGVSFGSGSQYLVRVNSNTDFDSTTVTGTTVLGNAILSVNLSGAGSGFNVGTDKLYILRMASGNSLQAGTTFNVANDAPVGSTSLYTFYAFYDYTPGGGVYLMPLPVPEPGFVLAAAAGALGLIRLRRRSN
jgi:fibronectin-binding autotransporter adhesin